MRIICPSCRFSRDVPLEKIPSQAELATCPKCGSRFFFRGVAPQPAEDAVAESSLPQPPLSAGMGQETPAAQPAANPVPGAHPAQAPDAEAFPAAAPAPEAEPASEAPAPTGEAQPLQPDMWQRLECLDFARQRDLSRGAFPVLGVSAAAAPSCRDSAAPPHPERVARPSAGFPAPGPGDPPWEQLQHRGFFPGLLSTISLALFAPAELFKDMNLALSLKRPMAFFILMSVIQAMAAHVWLVFQEAHVLEARGLSPYFFPVDSPLGLGGGLLLVLLLAPLAAMPLLFGLALLHHLFLRIFQAGPCGFRATFRVLAYAQSAGICAVIPFIGPFLGLFWFLAIAVVGCRTAHHTGYAQTACAFASLYALGLAFALVVAYFVGS